ncbi:MAG: 30S ribosomal protein S20, partial [Candidatus Yanofskybacteria bacterium RIFCSPHIGHO2_02_FULL_46_19]
QSKKRRTKNLQKKEVFKTVVKEFKKLVVAGKFDDAKKILPLVYKKLDKAAKSGVIKKNKASRLKSRATKLLKK